MASALHVGLPSSRLGRAFQSVLASLNPRAGEGVEIQVANAAWFDVEASFRPAFGRALDRHYGAAVAQADFGSDPAAARQKINEWGSEHTHGLIPEILSADARLGRGSFVLANAAHFRGAWAQPFSKVLGEYFRRADAWIDAPFMRELGEFGLAEDADLLAVELPYVGREVSMVVLMPQHGRLAEFEATLTPESLSRSIAALADTELELHFPSFSVASRADLTDALKSLGMVSAFDPRTADFSRAARGGGYLDAVGQNAYLRVNQEGTVAAVVTVVTGIGVGQAEHHAPPIVRVDSPFIFLVRHVATGTILFMGRVEDPKAQ
jgi:serpin B